MKVKNYVAVLCVLMSVSIPLNLRALDSTLHGEPEWESHRGLGCEPISNLLAEPKRRDELLAYAKAVFLHRLGFAGPAVRPVFLERLQRACFVTFFSGKKVIACFGGFYPREGSIAREIEENVSMALRLDPRARSIGRKTAMAADVQITFPEGPEAVRSYRQVNPLHEGLLVENDRSGVAIVPGEAKTASWAFREAMVRLGEKDPARVRLSRFRAFEVSSRNTRIRR